MATSASKFIGIKGCAVYANINGSFDHPPQADNVTISVPEIAFGTTDVNFMGTISIPDMTSLDNITLSINIPIDNPDARVLTAVGLQQWKITYCVSNMDKQGLETLTPCCIYAKGFVTGVPNAEVSKGGDGLADVSMNLMSFTKIVGNETLYDIDRSSNKLKVNGINYNNVDTLF